MDSMAMRHYQSECNSQDGAISNVCKQNNNVDRTARSTQIEDVSIRKSIQQTNLIVNYLPQTMSQEEMKLLFAKVGRLNSCKLIRDRVTGKRLNACATLHICKFIEISPIICRFEISF